MSIKVTILGSGSAAGVPRLALGWGACDPNNPKNRRMRPSILVENGNTIILVDTSPDLREQLIRADVKRIDGLIYTHWHADHVHGIDDLRELNRAMQGKIETWADAFSLKIIRERFDYAFTPQVPEAKVIYKPLLTPRIIEDNFSIGDISIKSFVQDHGFGNKSIGLIFDDVFGYSTDVVNLPDEAFSMLNNIDLWIVGCMTYVPIDTHANLSKVLSWIERIKPKHSVLTHLSHYLDYKQLADQLPSGVEPAFDGMILEAGIE